jgi:RNA polymerase sigma-70 factor, ECF subfamily
MKIIPLNKDLSMYKDLPPDEKVEVLFRIYYPVLCKSIFRILKDESVAEDIVQEVFLKVLEKKDSLKLDDGMRSYIYRSCYNAALNYLNQQKKFRNEGSESLKIAGHDSAENTLNFLEAEQQISKAVEALPPKTKLVFTMSRFEDLSYKEIAERLDISIKSVEKHMGIALQRLRESLREILLNMLLIIFSNFL